MKIHALIPARLESTRLPRKLLLDRTGKPLICHTLDSVLACGLFDSVTVLTNSPEIKEVTHSRCRSLYIPDSYRMPLNGTERIAIYLLRWRTDAGIKSWPEGDLIVNVQADEPCLRPHHFKALVNFYEDNPAADVATACKDLSETDRSNENVVKVMLTQNYEVCGFARWMDPQLPVGAHFHHLGVYAFNQRYLDWYLSEGPDLDSDCDLEQNRLRARHVATVLHDFDGVSVNTAEDYDAFCDWCSAQAPKGAGA